MFIHSLFYHFTYELFHPFFSNSDDYLFLNSFF